MPASEMPGDLKMINLVWFIVNGDICQQETGICKTFSGKTAYLSYTSTLT